MPPRTVVMDSLEPITFLIRTDGIVVEVGLSYRLFSADFPEASITKSVSRPIGGARRQAVLDAFADAVATARSNEGLS